MKHLQTPFLALCGSVCLFLSSCNTQGKNENAPAENAAKEATVQPPKDLISLKEAKRLYDGYSINRVPIIEAYEAKRDPQEFVVARYAAFDFETIRQYVSYVEQEANKAGVEVESLRFYFGNNPNSPTYPNGRQVVHPRQNGIFILPTLVNAERDQEFGFYIGSDGKAQLIRDWSANLKGQADLGSKSNPRTAEASLVPISLLPSPIYQGDGSLILNYSQGGPPPPDDF
ncbi:hypothetical protein [Aureicoccus marinus]|uniref:hypothetical protein n=1 Tax=Aureicoccus marinus TaxID=754435 RepID=UPI000CF520F2|nr:hypothetical protein [Aureicoccus marinus]